MKKGDEGCTSVSISASHVGNNRDDGGWVTDLPKLSNIFCFSDPWGIKEFIFSVFITLNINTNVDYVLRESFFLAFLKHWIRLLVICIQIKSSGTVKHNLNVFKDFIYF